MCCPKNYPFTLEIPVEAWVAPMETQVVPMGAQASPKVGPSAGPVSGPRYPRSNGGGPVPGPVQVDLLEFQVHDSSNHRHRLNK